MQTEKQKKLATYQREYLAKNREKINERRRQRNAERKDELARVRAAWRKTDLGKVHTLLQNARNRARRKGIEFSLKEEDIVIPECCPVLGIKLETGKGTVHAGSPQLDRIDNSKGYTKDNVIVVSKRANTIKSDATIDELRRVADFYGSN